MSFLSIRGSVVHCEDCDEKAVIEYEGGNQLTQIGDQSVIEQVNLNTTCNPRDYDAEIAGYYYHTSALCEQCFQKQYGNKALILEPGVALFEYGKLRDELNDKIDEPASRYAEEYLDNFTETACERINPPLFAEIKDIPTYGSKNDKRNLVERYLKESQSGLRTELLIGMRQSSGYQDFMLLREQCLGFEKEVLSLASQYNTGFYPIDFEQPVNLNPYICYEGSVRYPGMIYANTVFYDGPIDISIRKLRKHFNKLRELTGHLPDGLLDDVTRRLQNVMVKMDFWRIK